MAKKKKKKKISADITKYAERRAKEQLTLAKKRTKERYGGKA